MILLVAPSPSAEECRLIGRATQISFLTEDISAKFEEWRERGVHFHGVPRRQPGGGSSSTFEDVDRNSFTLLCVDEMTREIESERLAHAERHAVEQRTILELEVARQTQARLFPQTPPPLKSLDCQAACFQARAVGGDYFDFLDLGREHMGLVICDISGKGTAAALLMANLQAHLHNLCTTYWNRPYVPFVKEQPARFLQTVNQLFYENTLGNAYSTLFFGEFDDSTQGCVIRIVVIRQRFSYKATATCNGSTLPARFWGCSMAGMAMPGSVNSPRATLSRSIQTE